MTDQQLFELVHNELFKTGSCKPNAWFTVKFEFEGRTYMLEAMLPTRGNMRVRKPVKKYGVNGYGETIYLYDVYRFTNKKELKTEGYMEDVRPEEVNDVQEVVIEANTTESTQANDTVYDEISDLYSYEEEPFNPTFNKNKLSIDNTLYVGYSFITPSGKQVFTYRTNSRYHSTGTKMGNPWNLYSITDSKHLCIGRRTKQQIIQEASMI